MGFLSSDMGSPVQKHPVQLANDVMWISGTMETLGNPHNYINKDSLTTFLINDPNLAPWLFTGLPASHTSEISVALARVQFLTMAGQEALEQYQKPPHMEPVIFNLPLFVIRGDAPFLSDAKFRNFLDFWKGTFFPIIDAEIHYLTDGPAELPTRSPMVYINQDAIQNYIPG